MAFIYPDFKTALLGSFNSGEMEAAKEVSVAGYDEESSSLSFGPSRNPSAIFAYDPSEGDTMSSNPMLKDPYEARLAEIRQSTIPKVRKVLVGHYSFHYPMRNRHNRLHHLGRTRRLCPALRPQQHCRVVLQRRQDKGAVRVLHRSQEVAVLGGNRRGE